MKRWRLTHGFGIGSENYGRDSDELEVAVVQVMETMGVTLMR